jgi:phosphatidate cytidylyltransferase
MMGGLLQVTLAGFAVGAAGMALANRRVARGVARQRWLKLAVFFLIVHAVLVACIFGHPAIEAQGMVIVAIGAGELWRAWRRMPPPRSAAVWPLFLTGSAVFVASLRSLMPGQVAFLFVVVATFDGFSQVTGQWLGQHQLAPAISPNKTAEGLAGGVFAAMVFAVLMRQLVPTGLGWAGLLGAGIATAALAGDLASSWVKRRAGLKDYAATLPGQGGFLDRFNSFIAAGALIGPVLHAWP